MPIGKLDYFSDRILPQFVKISRNISINDILGRICGSARYIKIE